MLKSISNLVLVTVCTALFVFGKANADLIPISSVSYVGTASAQGGLNLNNPDNIINGSGLNGTLAADGSNLATLTHDAVSFAAPGNAWATIDAGAAGGDWFTAGQNDGSVIFNFDLGGIFEVDQIAVWGYHFNAFNGNSISSIDLSFSLNGGLTFDSTQSGISISLPSSFGLATIAGMVPTNANFIQMTVTDNHFGAAAGGDRVGIAEIAFTGTAIPEPGSIFVVVVGLGSVIFRRHRRAMV